MLDSIQKINPNSIECSQNSNQTTTEAIDKTILELAEIFNKSVIMDKSILDTLLLPILVILVAAIIGFIASSLYKRHTLKVVLLTEINSLISSIKTTLEYLRDSKHYWLQVNNKITTYPVDTMPPARFYQSIISNLHLLKTSEVNKIFKFYRFFETTENLKQILFYRIKRHADLNTMLKKEDVDKLIVERNRIIIHYNAIISSTGTEPIKKIKMLPDEYIVPSTKEISDEVNEILNPTE